MTRSRKTSSKVLVSAVEILLFLGICLSGNSLAGPYAYVPGGTGIVGTSEYAVIYKIDLGNRRKVKVIPIDSWPQEIALHRDGAIALITTHSQVDSNGIKPADGIGTVVVLDTISGKPLRKIETGRFPRGIVINHQKNEFYVGVVNRLIVYDLTTFSKKSEYPVEGVPMLFFFSDSSGLLYFSTDSGGTPIFVFDGVNITPHQWPAKFSAGKATERQGKRLFITSASKEVLVVDVASREIVATIDIGGETSGIVASDDADEIYVATTAYHQGVLNVEVAVLDSLTGAIKRRIWVPVGPSYIYNVVNLSKYFPQSIFVVTVDKFVVLNLSSGLVENITPIRRGDDSYPTPTGGFVSNYSKDVIDSNRLFNWAEDKYPQIFPSPPQRPFSETAEGYYFRHYPGTGNYLGTKGGNVFFLPAGTPLKGVLDLGPMDKFLPDADKDGY